MCLKTLCALAVLLSLAGVCVAGTSVVPTTTLAAQTAKNSSAASSFTAQTNGNTGARNVSKVDVHSLLYSGADTKIYAHLLLWFGGSNHMNVGYNSADAAQVQRQISDMVSRGIDGVIIDWYGQNNSIDDATKLVMAEAEKHRGFTFAIMIDQGAIEWYSCSGCSPQQALVNDLQYIEQTYFPSPAYMTYQGKPVVTNFNIDLSYSVDWNAANGSLSTRPDFVFQNNDGFSHTLSGGSYSWVMPTTSDYGMAYLNSFYNAGMPFNSEQTVGATYKGFNDTLASWGSNRIMGQQCGQTWLQTFNAINSLYSAGKQLPYVQLVTWNDYEEATEIESGIDNCLSISASASGNSLKWTVNGNDNTLDHYVSYISTDGQNLMALGSSEIGTNSLNLCSYSIPNGSYTAFVQAVGKPSIVNHISDAVKVALNCGSPAPKNGTVSVAAAPAALALAAGTSGKLNVTVAPQSGPFNGTVALSCSGLPASLNCAFSPASVTPGSQSAISVLTITSTQSSPKKQQEHHALLGALLPGLGIVGIALVGKFQRKSLLSIMGLVLLSGLVIGNTSCGGQSMNPVNASTSVPNNYVVTINGVAGSIQASTAVTVTVK